VEDTNQFDDKPEFEDEEEDLDPARPYPATLQELDLYFGTAVTHLAVLPPIVLRAEGPTYRGLECLRRNIVFVAACTDNSLRLITLPLTPPSPASKSRPGFRTDFSSANAGKGKWGDAMVLLSGHQRPANAVSMTIEHHSKLTEKANSTTEPHYIVASHSSEVSGLLMLFRTSIKSPRPITEPFQSIYLSSPAKCISFNCGLDKDLSSHLLVADSLGACRVYDYKLLIKSPEEPVETLGVEKGTWLLSLYAGFHTSKSDFIQTNTGTCAGFGRKSIVDAQWVSGGRAIVVLLDDGEWALWDIQGVGPDAAKGLLGRQGIKGGSKSEYSISGYLDGMTKSRPSGPPQITASKFAPMTPGTRKSTEPFSARALNGSVRGQISVIEIPSTSATSPTEEVVLFWFGETYSVIPNLAKYWTANSRKTGGTANLFNGPSNSRMIKLENINLEGERCSGVDQFPKTTSSQLDIVIVGEHRYVIFSMGKPSRSQLPVQATGRLVLTETHENNGELDVMGIEQALTRMENGVGTKRKIFQS